MADELTLNVTMEYSDAFGVEQSVSVVDRKVTITTKKPVILVQEIGITEEAIDLGDTGTPAYAFFQNLDPTNFITLRVATSGAAFARLDPDTDQDGTGGFAMLRLSTGATAPFAIADTAACKMKIMIVPA